MRALLLDSRSSRISIGLARPAGPADRAHMNFFHGLLASRLPRRARAWGAHLCTWRWFAGLAVFAMLVLFRLHGFSLESWDFFIREKTPSYRYRSIGINRYIRSDEFMVSVPFVMAQCGHPGFFPRVNNRCGGGEADMFVATPPSPVWDWTAIGQAANWGYFLFGFERGLAWNWWLRYLLGFLFAFEFFMIWLRHDRPLALVAAMAVTLGAPTQWWTTTIPYLNLFFFASLVFVHKLFAWQKPAARLAAGAGLAVSLCSFSFSFYPPFQFLYAVALLPLGAEMIWLARLDNRQQRPVTAWLILVGALLVLAGEWLYFLSTHSETMAALASSTYPGKRCLRGGSLRQFLDMQSWKFVTLLTPFRHITYLNACEVSVFFVPMAATTCAFFRAGRTLLRESPAAMALAAWSLAMLLWMAFVWPEKLARLSFFSQISVGRTAVVSSFLFLLLTFKTAHIFMRDKLRCHRAVVSGAIAASLALLAVGLHLNPALAGCFTDAPRRTGVALLALGATLLAGAAIGLLRNRRMLFLSSFTAIALLAGAGVNPISQGAAPLLQKQLAGVVHAVQRNYGDGLWLCNSSITAQFIAAQGVNCAGGVQQTANAALWRKADPAEKFKTAWNSYAHLSFAIAEPGKTTAYRTPNTGDCVSWELDETAIRNLGVHYLLWSGQEITQPWSVYVTNSGPHFIYRVAASAAAGE